MRAWQRALGRAAAYWYFLGCAAIASAQAPLGHYNVKLDETTVSGISSGAYMAVQFGVAHSAAVRGVGAIAAGPYYCAQDSLTTAFGTCMIGTPSLSSAVSNTNAWASSGLIDATANLARQKIWLFNGYNDGVVKRQVTDVLYNYYKSYVAEANLYYKTNLKAAHSQVTDGFGQACNQTGGNFMNNCGYDAAGLILRHLLGQLNARNTGTLSGSVVKFYQSEFGPSDPWSVGLWDYGYAYVPANCAGGAACRVHVAFHGCKQSASAIGSDYYAHAGYNAWADTNSLIVLYPQAVATSVFPYPFNPNGCWDWWGYNESSYAQKGGSQIQAVYAMLTRLAGGYTGWTGAPGGSFGAPANLTATDSSNTRVSLAWSPVAGASGYNVYRATCSSCSFTKVNAALVTGASFGDRSLAASTAYYYKLRAVNGSGSESADSAVVSKSTAAAPPFCDPYHRDNVSHVDEGRAYVFWGYDYAFGSNNVMGLWNALVETDLRQSAAGSGSFSVGPCS